MKNTFYKYVLDSNLTLSASVFSIFGLKILITASFCTIGFCWQCNMTMDDFLKNSPSWQLWLLSDGRISTLRNPNGGWYTYYPNSASYRASGLSPLPQVSVGVDFTSALQDGLHQTIWHHDAMLYFSGHEYAQWASMPKNAFSDVYVYSWHVGKHIDIKIGIGPEKQGYCPENSNRGRE